MLQFFVYEYQWMAYAGAVSSSAIAFVVFILLARKHEAGKARTVRYLRDMVGFLVIAPTIDYVIFTVNGIYPTWRETFNYVALGSYMSFTMNAIANIFLIFFLRDVFFDGKKKGSLIALAALEASVGPALVAVFFTGDPDLPLAALLVHVCSALAIYVIQASNAFKLRDRIKRDETKQVESHGLAYIGASGLIMLAAVALFVAHEAIILVPVREYWTVTLGWLLGAIAGIVVYLGYTPPERLKARWAGMRPSPRAAPQDEKHYS